MNKSVIFLIFLIAPFAFAQSDVLQMLDKTVEGKEIINHLFIQTKLMGATLDVGVLSASLTTAQANAKKDHIATSAYEKRVSTGCKADQTKLHSIVEEHHQREFALRRSVKAAKRLAARKTVFQKRTSDELDNYRKFSGYIQNNKNSWTNFYTSARKNNKQITILLTNIQNALRGVSVAQAALNAEAQAQIVSENTSIAATAAMIELTPEYHTNLAEIKLNLSALDNDLSGLAPIINNLLEIVQNTNALTKEGVRNALRSLTTNLMHRIRDRADQLSEENSHQVSLFASLEKSFNANVARTTAYLATATAALKKYRKRQDNISEAAGHATRLSDSVRSILALRVKECRQFKETQSFAVIRYAKISEIISQLQEIVASRSSSLKGFFIQREMRERN